MLRNERAYALFLVISMVAVLSFIFIGILTVYRVRFGQVVRFGNNVKARYMAEAGIERAKYLLSTKPSEHAGQAEEVLSERAGYRVTYADIGGFIEVKSMGYTVRESVTVTALLGERNPASLVSAVRLNHEGGDCVVAGKNEIIGSVTLIKGQLFESRVTGFPFLGDTACNGPIIRKEKEDTLFDAAIKESIKQQKGWLVEMSRYDEVFHSSITIDNKTYRAASFRNKKVFVEGMLFITDSVDLSGGEFVTEQMVYIENKSRLRNCVIVTSGGLILRSGSKVRECRILTRKSVWIQDSSSLSGIVMAEDSIKIEGQAKTLYPTFVYSWPAIADLHLQGGIFLTTNQPLSGVFVVAERDTAHTLVRFDPLQCFCYIAPQTEITGLVYNNYTTDYEGKIKGHITTDGFVLLRNNKTYGNFLNNTLTDRTALSDQWVVPAIFSKEPEWAVLSLTD
ncbi:MAG: hypothetical protein A2293_10265 [Elusimicrobia bacterium RIFOXYB2_FULL_49_7]|nr:MAG: hypothetical protein A2293_10265 [Elusimicrobia bacterium RIFOXYB2_FULL_49_7]